jgi:hypothetical protein
MHNNKPDQLSEGLEYGDLARLIHTKLHIDEFKSKMGDDADIVILSLKVGGKEPANDLMNFIERGYDWVLDADISAGELDDGEYLVFVEIDRNPRAPEQIMKLMDDLMNLTEQDLSDWKFQYRKSPVEYELSEENLRKKVPLTPNNYLSLYGHEDAAEDDITNNDLDADDEDNIELKNTDKELAAMQEAARVPVAIKAPVNDFTQNLRAAAGII